MGGELSGGEGSLQAGAQEGRPTLGGGVQDPIAKLAGEGAGAIEDGGFVRVQEGLGMRSMHNIQRGSEEAVPTATDVREHAHLQHTHTTGPFRCCELEHPSSVLKRLHAQHPQRQGRFSSPQGGVPGWRGESEADFGRRVEAWQAAVAREEGRLNEGEDS